MAAVLANGLRKYLVLKKLGHDQAQIEEQVVKSMESYGVHIVSALERHLPILATISSVAPMLGFLGTVAGMIQSFEDIVAKMGEVNIVEAAASGISVALYTTAFGLIVGIPAYLFFNYFSSVINSFRPEGRVDGGRIDRGGDHTPYARPDGGTSCRQEKAGQWVIFQEGGRE